MPHLNAAQAGALARRAGAGALLLTHCYPEHDRAAALGAARARLRRTGRLGAAGRGGGGIGPGRRAPTGGRALALAVVLSLVMPGLGHVYIGRFLRALIWFGGALVIGAIVDRQGVSAGVFWGMVAALAAFAAIDAAVLVRTEAKGGGRRA